MVRSSVGDGPDSPSPEGLYAWGGIAGAYLLTRFAKLNEEVQRVRALALALALTMLCESAPKNKRVGVTGPRKLSVAKLARHFKGFEIRAVPNVETKRQERGYDDVREAVLISRDGR